MNSFVVIIIDVLALLIHLGYLAYNPEKETAEIPNEEIRTEFQKAVQSVKCVYS